MKIQEIKKRLVSRFIFLTDQKLGQRPGVIGYEKRFRWRWLATQLNTFVVATDFGDEMITEQAIEYCLNEAFDFATKNYTGWPRGFQSGLAVIVILISTSVDENAVLYCRELRSGKKWAGFSVPVVFETRSNQAYSFERNPVWGGIYYPYFRRLIDELLNDRLSKTG